MTTHTISNIAYKVIDTDIRVLYRAHGSGFDSIIFSLDTINYCLDTTYSHYYDLYITHNGFDYAQEAQSWCNAMHLNAVVFFHKKPPAKLKKEDAVILKNSLYKTHKIFVGPEIAASWNADTWTNAHIVEYGVPVMESVPKKNKSILFINQSNNSQVNNLYSSLVQKFPNSEILQTLPLDMGTAIKTLSDYTVVVDMDSPINILLASSCGCKTITSPIITINADIRESYKIMNYDNLTKIIENIIFEPINNSDINYNKDIINKNYNYNNFKNQLADILTKAKKEIFIL
jgi:hypothetical protein